MVKQAKSSEVGGRRDEGLAFARPDRFTVLIPAHNEATVIGSTLRLMLEGAPPGGAPEVLVIANGCTDDTAAEARRAAPRATVLELAIGSKALAINAGLGQTRTFPVIIVDGDIAISFDALDALAQALREPGVMAASPAARLEMEGCDRFVRAFYRVWAIHDYLGSGVGGSGVYGLSEAGAAEIGELPIVLADDTYVRRAFPLSLQRRVDRDRAGRAIFSRVQAPRSIANLLRCEARWHSGNVQLRSLSSHQDAAATGARRRPTHARKASLPDLAVYYAVKLLGRGLALFNRLRGRAGTWHRDASRR